MTGLLALCLVTAFAVLPRLAEAQRFDVDGSVGWSSSAWRLAASAEWHPWPGNRLDLSAGVRLSYYQGDAKSYRNQGPVTSELPDRLLIDPSVWGLNLMVSGRLRLFRRLAFGANIDLAGVAGGPERPGAVTLKPARGSLLLYGDRDRGSLNSEFFLAVTVSDGLEVRGGASHYVVGYRASDGAADTRYLRFDTVPFLALRIRP